MMFMHDDVKLVRAMIALGWTLIASAALAQKTVSPSDPRTGPHWVYTTTSVTNAQGELTITASTALGAGELYVRKSGVPSRTVYDFKVANLLPTKTIKITNRSSPALLTGTYNIGYYLPYGRDTVTFTKTAKSTKTEFDIKGAIPFANGTSFKLWAPNASAVNVAGAFNSWSTTATPLVSEGNGWWSLDLRGASAGQEYKYVLKNGTNTFWKNDPWARKLVNSVGNAIIYSPTTYNWQSSNFQTPSWNDLVIYEMHVGAFNDTAGGSPGNFATAIAKLDYLKDMGVNGIELLPVQEFPGDFSWGYNGSFPFSVESAYGGPEGLKQFVDECNKRGMAVLLDVIHNHYGPNDLDMWRYDGWYQGAYGGVFFYNDSRADTPWGSTRPDYGRSEVRQYIRDNQMQWVNEFRVSGLRWDSTLNMRTTNSGDNADGWSLLQWLNNELDAAAPGKINIAEDLQNNEWLTKATSQGGAGFDSQWSNFVHTLRGAITGGDDNARSMTSVRDALNERFNGDAFRRVIYTESHDEDANGKQRVPSEIDSANPGSYWAQKRSTLGAALVMTAPGIPMLFMGQEILEDGYFSDSDPIDWSKLTTYSGINKMYKDLIALRRNLGGKSNGLKGQGMNVFHVNDTGKVLAFHRYMNGGSGDDVVVVANFKNATYNNYRIGMPRSGNWSVVFNSDWNGYSSLFGNLFTPNVTAGSPAYDGLGQSATVNIAPYSVVILAKD